MAIIQYLDTLAILVASAKFDASSDIVVIKRPLSYPPEVSLKSHEVLSAVDRGSDPLNKLVQ